MMDLRAVRWIRKYVSLAFKVSRFRFWFYLAGPYTVGYVWGAGRLLDLLSAEFLGYLVYFLLPANVFLYGVNDYWDEKTDRLNPKKRGKEHLVDAGERRALVSLLAVSMGLSALFLLLQKDLAERLIFSSFLFLGYFYSARPLRFKAVPFLDLSSNFLYAVPGVFGYYQVTGSLPPWIIILVAFLHTSAMQLFSAIPDIEYDERAGLTTTAVLLGEKASMLLCLVLWSSFSLTVIHIGGYALPSFLPLVYPILVSLILLQGREAGSFYWFFPYINVGLGGLLYLLGAIQIPFA